ncbi:MAG: alpha/beta fold hydrolase [Ktedonobacterales bacterium]
MSDEMAQQSRRARGTRRSTATRPDTGNGTGKLTGGEGPSHGAALTELESALEEERRQRAAAEKALAEAREQLALAQEAVERERRRAEDHQRSSSETQSSTARPAAGRTRDSADPQAGGDSGQNSSRSSDMDFWMSSLGEIPGADFFVAGQRMALAAMKQPWLAMQQSTTLMDEMMRIATGRSEIAPDAKDKRFADPTWSTNPMYKAYMQTYLLWRKSLNNLVDQSDLPKKDADRARFALSLFTEAVAPTNTMLGNPAAMKQFYQTGGQSAVRGLTHMIEDVAKNGGLPSQVDMKAFTVGKDLALSKGAVVFKNEVMEVIQYSPSPESETTFRRPMLIVPPQINKYYILDLSPGKSVAEYLTRAGFTLFTISWRNPTTKQRDWGLETYSKAILDAMDVVRDITGEDSINITGVCAGGMTLAVVLGHLAAKGDRAINSATFMVTVLDSSVESQLGLFASPETIAAAKLASKSRGVLEGQEMARVFAWLRPNDLIWNYWVNNYLIGSDPAAFDILYWNNDSTRLPAKFHSDILDFWLKNPLVKRGSLKVLGTPIDLAKVELDTFISAGITDHITPWQGSYATTQLLGGKSLFVLSNAGHIQSILNPPGNPKATYFTGTEYPADPQQWLARAEQHSGSWWELWQSWLGERSGERIPAPRALGNKQYPAGTPAPGTYVFEP